MPRVGLTASGRGTVAWNDGSGSILSRDFTLGGSLGTGLSVTRGSGGRRSLAIRQAMPS